MADVERRVDDCLRLARETTEKMSRLCSDVGITGENIDAELKSSASGLSRLFNSVTSDVRSVQFQRAITAYLNFTGRPGSPFLFHIAINVG
jgi:hypothetical protein